MTTPKPPTTGQTDTRYPFTPPSFAVGVSLIEKRQQLPSARLTVLSFRRTLAPGMIKSQGPRSYGEGAVRLAGFVFSVCVVSDGGEWQLEVSLLPWDEWRGQREALVLSSEMLAALYRAVQQWLLADEGRAYGRSAGRN